MKDPHNLPLRLLAELGIVGFALGIGWLLMLAKDLTRPAGDADSTKTTARGALWPAAIAASVPAVATIDFAADTGHVVIECMQAAVSALAVIAVAIVVTARSAELDDADDSPAPSPSPRARRRWRCC